jgi:hypothetical protein
MKTKANNTRRTKKLEAQEASVMDRFIRDVRAGKSPDPELVLRRHPQFERSLRPTLDGMVLLDKEYRRFRKQNPTVDIEALFGIPRKLTTKMQ